MDKKICDAVMRSYNDNYDFYLLRAVAAGFLIGIGALLSQWAAALTDNPLIPPCLFCFGLCMVFRFNAALFTGEAFKVTYTLLSENRVKFLPHLGISVLSLLSSFAGNAVGSVIISFMATRTLPHYVLQKVCEKAASISEMDMVTLALSAIMCNVMVGLATMNNLEHGFNGDSAIITAMCVIIFVAFGWQHSVANITYTVTACFYTGELPETHIAYTAFFNFIGGGTLATGYFLGNFLNKKR